jgi:hypothetical protein
MVSTGTATELAPSIRVARRAVVFVGAVWSNYSVLARKEFVAMASRARPDVRFFVIENESDDDARAWAAEFADNRLLAFGDLGAGWVLWLEDGQLREVDEYAGGYGKSMKDIEKVTRALWP